MLDHVRQCLLQAQFMDPEVRDEGIEKETLKTKLRHKMTADMNKIREHLKTIARIYNSAYKEAGVDVYLEPWTERVVPCALDRAPLSECSVTV